MARPKNIRKKGIPASTYRPRRPDVKISSQDLSDRFAQMRLTASQSEAIQILGNSCKKASSLTKQRRSPKITSKEDVAKTGDSHSHADVFPPAIPKILYLLVKDVVDIKKDPNWHSDSTARRAILHAEGGISTVCRCFSESMPIGWKYDRDHAESLIVGYDTVFVEDGFYWII
ncbi:hypothetical protein Hdeb2414_s0001g00034791 [Helianthus debilis subsp. tardiflorus]